MRVGATKVRASTAVRTLFRAAWHSRCVAKPPLIARRRSSVSCKLAAALRTGLSGLALDPEALVAALAALRRGQADIDDVLEAGLAPAADVTAHADLLDARLPCNSSFALGGKTSNAQAGTRSTGCVPTLHLFGAPSGRQTGRRKRVVRPLPGVNRTRVGVRVQIRRAGSNGP